MRTKLLSALIIPLAALGLAAPASAAPSGGTKPLKCVASDPQDVQVDSISNTVTITGDPSTAGNNFGCYTNLKVMAGDVITFNYIGACGGGVPRLYVRFAGNTAGENTFDTVGCPAGATQTVTYTLQSSGKIVSFAFINDRGDGGTVTYSNLTIAGNVIDF